MGSIGQTHSLGHPGHSFPQWAAVKVSVAKHDTPNSGRRCSIVEVVDDGGMGAVLLVFGQLVFFAAPEDEPVVCTDHDATTENVAERHR